MFLITQFLATEAFGMNTLVDRKYSPPPSFPLFVRQLSQVLTLHFKDKFEQLFLQRVLRF